MICYLFGHNPVIDKEFHKKEERQIMKKGEYIISIKKTWNTTFKAWDYEIEKEDKDSTSSTLYEDLETALAMAYRETNESKIKGLGNLEKLQHEDLIFLGALTRQHFSTLVEIAKHLLDSFYRKE